MTYLKKLWCYNMVIRTWSIVRNQCTTKVNLNSLQYASTTQNKTLDKLLIKCLFLAIAMREHCFTIRNCLPNNLTNPWNLGWAIIVNDVFHYFPHSHVFLFLFWQLKNCVYKLPDKQIMREEHANLGSCLEGEST